MLSNKALQLITSLSIILLFSCEAKKPIEVKKAILTGHITSPSLQKISLSNKPIPLEKEWSNVLDTTGIITKVDTKGNFNFVINIEKPDFYRLSYGPKSIVLYLEPNDSISIVIDSLPTFQGANKSLNAYLKKHKDALDKTESYILENLGDLYGLNHATFNTQLDSLKNQLLSQTNTFFEITNSIPLIYKNRLEANTESLIRYYKLLYPVGYQSITRNKATLPKNFFKELAVGLNDPQFLNSKRYTKYLDKYVEIMAAGDFKSERYDVKPLEKIQSRYNAIKTLEIEQEVKDYLFEQHFKLCNTYYSAKHWKTILDDFTASNNNKALKNKILKDHKTSLTIRQEPNKIKTYKTISDIELEAHIFYPENHQKNVNKAAFLFFHGGGWSLGLPENGYQNCKRMAQKGMVAISFEYRLIDVHGNSIQKGLEDAKSAIRWVRANASELGIDPNKIVATGFSAGAHLAATTAMIDDFVSQDNSGFSSKPNLVITQSSNYTAEGDFFMGVSNGQPQSVSLLNNIKPELPPFLILHASNDYIDPVYTFYQFKSKMEAHNNAFEFKVFDGVDHFFSNPTAKKEVIDLIDEFLETRGYF